MPANLEKLLAYLEVERIDKYLFVGNSPAKPKRIFGGQVLAQSLNAATRSVDEDRIAHSMHAYFLRPGDPSKQIVFEVDPIRDGRSFTTRRVVAKQDARAIFSTSISFQKAEDGLEHQATMPDVPPPEELETDLDFYKRMSEKYPERFKTPPPQAIERRNITRRDYLDPQPTEPVQHMWFRAPEGLGDNLNQHQTVLTYISDFGLLGAATLPHPYTGMSANLQAASLDHAIWFHKPFRVDEYLLYTMDSTCAAGSRGFARGMFFTRSGELVASTVQEALIRVRSSEE